MKGSGRRAWRLADFPARDLYLPVIFVQEMATI